MIQVSGLDADDYKEDAVEANPYAGEKWAA